jgi:hypothetical protein
VDMDHYYDFIYRASSSSVHASLQELARMVWGNTKTGAFAVSRDTFHQYYFRFALVYGGWVASMAALSLARHLKSNISEDALESVEIVAAFFIKPCVAQQAPGLVTLEELRWRDR